MQRAFIVFAPVQIDKAKESIQEIQKELRGILGEITVTEDEFGSAKNAGCSRRRMAARAGRRFSTRTT